MKMNLKVNVQVSGNIIVTRKSNHDNVFGSTPEKRSLDSRESIDLNGLQFDISMEENVEDITPKEYIQAVGAAMKDVVSGFFQKQQTEVKEAAPLKMGQPGWFEQESARMKAEYEKSAEKMGRDYDESVKQIRKDYLASVKRMRNE